MEARDRSWLELSEIHVKALIDIDGAKPMMNPST